MPAMQCLLCLWLSKPRRIVRVPGGGRSVPGMPHIEAKQLNTTTASLCGPEWLVRTAL